ncbi:phage protein [Clostridium botulinum H04402 065]|uniref:hypothetical protein n=1 Tax=Clostridium botulinum TaxID=1491 RepID=UPI0001F84A43|nr:hypothetical protein [Clostridium botulinum]NFC96117.1 hypothetical protein [Clostridium botulinum]NFD20418.1 hypothetical protein [Clostridium botulinum]NFD28114.1 hypothetical protein [Clostridium botulinum]NFE88408.1 hypothetical protein [Clostridium botulinum]NFF07166.1 hypothetical protein [Clostridium botulinum]
MAKYKKKPVIVEAVQYTGDVNTTEIEDMSFHEAYMNGIIREEEDNLLIKTLEGTMVVNKGDYIIKGVNGEFYPCKPDIFKKTYELVE